MTETFHSLPNDFNQALKANKDAHEAWTKITPLAKNEWICWITIVKKPETRLDHIRRACLELASGKKRPCCWPGCPHRRPTAKKWFKNLVV